MPQPGEPAKGAGERGEGKGNKQVSTRNWDQLRVKRDAGQTTDSR